MAVSTASAPVFIGSAASKPGDAADFFEKRPEPVVVIGARRHRQPLRLRGQRRENARMRVAVARRRIGAHHVDVAPAVGVPQMRAFAARQHDRQRRVVRGAYAIFQCDEIHGITPRRQLGAESDNSSVPENHNGLRGSVGRGRLIPPSVSTATAESAVVQSLLTLAQSLVVRAEPSESRELTRNLCKSPGGPLR